jgi:hypothetical protein
MIPLQQRSALHPLVEVMPRGPPLTGYMLMLCLRCPAPRVCAHRIAILIRCHVSVTPSQPDATPRRLHESSSNTQRQPAATASSASGVIRAPRTCSLQSLALMPQFCSLASAFSRPACTGRTRQVCVCRGRRPSGERCCNRRDVLSADDARPAFVSQPDASLQAGMRAASALSDEAAASPAPGRNAQSNATHPPALLLPSFCC